MKRYPFIPCPLCSTPAESFQYDYCHVCDYRFRWRRGIATLALLNSEGII